MSSLEIDQVENAYGEAVATGRHGDDFIAALTESLNRATPPPTPAGSPVYRVMRTVDEPVRVVLVPTPAGSPRWPSPDDEAAVEALAKALHGDITDPPFSMEQGAMCECAFDARAILAAITTPDEGPVAG